MTFINNYLFCKCNVSFEYVSLTIDSLQLFIYKIQFICMIEKNTNPRPPCKKGEGTKTPHTKKTNKQTNKQVPIF